MLARQASGAAQDDGTQTGTRGGEDATHRLYQLAILRQRLLVFDIVAR